jgi:aspartate aminotransferase-like enzyme
LSPSGLAQSIFRVSTMGEIIDSYIKGFRGAVEDLLRAGQIA